MASERPSIYNAYPYHTLVFQDVLVQKRRSDLATTLAVQVPNDTTNAFKAIFEIDVGDVDFQSAEPVFVMSYRAFFDSSQNGAFASPGGGASWESPGQRYTQIAHPHQADADPSWLLKPELHVNIPAMHRGGFIRVEIESLKKVAVNGQIVLEPVGVVYGVKLAFGPETYESPTSTVADYEPPQ